MVSLKQLFYWGILIGFGSQMTAQTTKSILSVFDNTESIKGKSQHLATPYNTTGDQLYMVGNQDGTFPDLGWHVKGEMGGIWHHPIKLLDGFEASISFDNQHLHLDKADAFINYPFGNKQLYTTISDKIIIERVQFVPDEMGVVYIEYVLKNKTNKPIQLNFDITTIANLMPVWLGERTGMIDSKDLSQYDSKKRYWVVKDTKNPWYVVYGSPLEGKNMTDLGSKSNKPNTSITRTQYSMMIQPNGVFYVPFIISGSAKSKEEATQAYFKVRSTAYELIQKKKKRLLQLDTKSKLTLNDKEVETAFRWLKYNSDWLTVNVSGMGKGMVAGLPDYPWWFGGDMAYSLKGLIASGRKDLTYSSIDLLQRVSEKNNGNGRIIHEVSTNGAVYNLGNVCETPQFASLIWDVYCWTGDKAFLNHYFPTIEKGLSWLVEKNDADGNSIPDGSGMMEIHGLNSEMIDVAVYSQKAFADASKMAKLVGKESLSLAYQKRADLLKEKINTDFWVKEFNSYADFIGTKEQALQLADAAIVRADTLKNKWAVEELKTAKQKIVSDTSRIKKGFVLYHNWVVNTPMETGIANKDQAISALNTAQKFTNSYGMFVTGIDRNEEAVKEENSFASTANKKEFTYTGTVMTLPTGVQVVAENNYGRPDEAYQLLKKITKTFSYALPGSMYEVSPDYGMMTQAWNIYAFGESIVKQFFGIQPLAYKKEITISPSLPKVLTDGKIENVSVGTNEITLGFVQTIKEDQFVIKQKLADWITVFSQPKGKYKKWMVNNSVVHPKLVGDYEQIRISGKNNNLQLLK
jgi:glycogen debranching enzyme